MPERPTNEDLELLGELGVDTEPAATGGRSAIQQRVIAGFEEVVRFVDERGHQPQHGEDRDIFERLYAVRLDRLRALHDHHELLKPLDRHGLLSGAASRSSTPEAGSDEDLLASLGVAEATGSDVTELKHVRGHVDRKAAAEIAQRTTCPDFEQFRSVFEVVQRELESGARQTARFQHNGKLEPGDLFILDGQKVLVAAAGETMMKEFGREDRRLRVIFDNGTESNMLLRSLQRALYKNAANRRILPAGDAAQLFADNFVEGDVRTGVVYILRSLSDHPFIAEHRDVIHKIGVTGGDVKPRIAGAKKDPTFLLADVELVAEYKLANINRQALEALLHKFFAAARLDVQLKDRFNSEVEPREWFLAPLAAVDEAIQRIKDGTIDRYSYDPQTACLVCSAPETRVASGDDSGTPE